MAAVELLIGHARWLRRDDFVARFVRLDGSADQAALAWVDWAAAVAALDTGGLPCSGSEAQVLRIAGSLAEGVLVDLGDAVTGLDEVTIGWVAAAVLRGNGHRGVAPVGGGDR